MLVELCVGNYETSNGLENNVAGIFENFLEIISKSLVWTHFHNPQIGHSTRIKNLKI
jgi:hypothetical protein